MAFVTTQTRVVLSAGYTPPLMYVYGTYLSSGGGTGGVIEAGYTNSSGTLTAVTAAPGTNSGIGGVKILQCILTPTASDATAPGAAISFDATNQRDKATIVTTADTGGVYCLVCTNTGATP